MEIKLQVTAKGGIQMLHDDNFDISRFGKPTVVRASNVEFDNDAGVWTVTSAKTGQFLHAASTRKAALEWEKQFYSPGGEGWFEITKEQGETI